LRRIQGLGGRWRGKLLSYTLHVPRVMKYVEREMALFCVNVTVLVPGRQLLRRVK
jgi:hypothetical protein